MNKWIDVKISLPKDHSRVLCVVEDDKFKEVKILDFTNGGYKWYCPETLHPVGGITHWMYIPEFIK